MVATTRRRHKAEGDSPLRALSTPPKRTRKSKEATPAQKPVINDVQTLEDPGAGIFFSMPTDFIAPENQASLSLL